MSLSQALTRIAAWFAGLATYKQTILCLAALMFVVEIAFRAFAPKSKAYTRWTHGIEAIGTVWTAVLLSLVYALSVGPISLLMRLFGKDPLDRTIGPEPSAWRTHEPNPLGPAAAARHQF